MSYGEPARTTTGRIRIRWIRVAGLVAVVAAIATGLGARHPVSSTTASPAHLPRSEHPGAADGAVPAGTTVFDDAVPGVARLDPALRGALRHAATAAAVSGVELLVDSGWRSPERQAQLLREAIARYGSETEALRWVASPETSAHVTGDAVDIGPSGAAAWLTDHGAAYGLCRIYANEPWHFELRPGAPRHGCPPVYADPTHDPGLRR